MYKNGVTNEVIMLTCPQKSGLKESDYLLAIRLDIAKSALFT